MFFFNKNNFDDDKKKFIYMVDFFIQIQILILNILKLLKFISFFSDLCSKFIFF